MFVERHSVTVLASGGTGQGYTPVVSGRILSLQYVKNNFTDGVDFTITAETTGLNLWTETNVNASATRCPRQATHGVDGTASLFAAGGTAVQDHIYLSGERVSVAVASAGNGTTGTFYVTVG